MLNIDFRGTHVFKSLFSIQLSLKIAQVEVSQTILKILCIKAYAFFHYNLNSAGYNIFMNVNQKVFNRHCSYWYQIKANLMPDTLKCICIHFDTSDYCQKLESGIPANLPR